MGFIERFKKIMKSRKETVQDEFAKTKSLNKIGVLSIAVDKDTELYLTPHTLMYIAYMIPELHPEIFSAYEQFTNFFMGKGVRSEVKEIDEKIQAIRGKLNFETRKAIWSYKISGNLYAQMFKENSDENQKYTKAVPYTKNNKYSAFTIIRDSSRIYYNMDAKDDNEFWLYSLHYTAGQAVQGMKPSFNTIKYAIQQVSNLLHLEYVLKLPKDEVIHYRSPYGRNDYYGHSVLMSSFSYSRSLKEIIDNVFRIAKYRAIGKKLIQLGDDNGAYKVSDKEMEDMEADFFSQEKDVMFINKPIKINDLTYSGQYDSMMSEIEYIRKAMMSSIPTSVTAFASEDFSNRSLSDNSMMGFFLGLEADRQTVLDFFSDILKKVWNIKGDMKLYFENIVTFEGEEEGLKKENSEDERNQAEPEEADVENIKLKKQKLKEYTKPDKALKESMKHSNFSENIFSNEVETQKEALKKKEKLRDEEINLSFDDLDSRRSKNGK